MQSSTLAYKTYLKHDQNMRLEFFYAKFDQSQKVFNSVNYSSLCRKKAFHSVSLLDVCALTTDKIRLNKYIVWPIKIRKLKVEARASSDSAVSKQRSQ